MLLRQMFGFHELAVEDSEHFDQRPKIEDYEDFVFLVFYCPSPDEDGLVEVHCFYSERYLVTVRRDDSPTLDGLGRGSSRTARSSRARRASSTRCSTALWTTSSRSSINSTIGLT